MIGQTLQIKHNTFLEDKNLTKRSSNSVTNFFLMLQFIYGFNYGFIDVLNKKIRNFCKPFFLLISLYTSIILLLNTPIFVSKWDIRIFWGSLYFIQYCGYIIILNFSEYKVHNFITDIRSIGGNIIHSKEHIIGLFAWTNCGCFFVLAVILGVVACIVMNSGCVIENKHVNAIYFLAIAGIDIIFSVQMIVNLYTYYAVSYLMGLLERDKPSFIRKQFLRLSECCGKFEGYYGNMVLLELFVYLPKYLTLICDFVYHFHENETWQTHLIRLLYSIYVIFQMCAPAVSVELVNKQMERLQFKLHKRLMEERDIVKHLELSSLLRFMEQRPLYSKAWRVIPTDISLVVALFSFVTTYIIVILQFMHIY